MINAALIIVKLGGLFCDTVSQVVVAGTGSLGSVNAVGTSASFNQQRGMSTSPDGSYVLIADFNNHKIRKLIVSTGVVSTFAGSGSAGGGDGVGTSATFNGPYGITISSDGSFAVSICNGGNRIRHIVMSTALVTTLAGPTNGVVGAGAQGTTNGVGTNARFSTPQGVALSNIDNTFALIADYWNGIIRKIVLSTKVVTRVAGSGAAAATDGIGTLAKIHGPSFIAMSSNDAFAVITEYSGHRIRKLVLSTWAVTTVAGSPTSAAGAAGVTGAADGVGTLASFNKPSSVLLTADNSMVYVADRDNHKVRRVELSSRRVSTLVAASGSVALNAPMGLTWIVVDQWLMISSFGSHRVHEMYGTCAPTGHPTGEPTSAPTIYTAPEGLFCDTVSQVVVAGNGSPGSVNAVGTSASFNLPHGMSTSPDGSYVLISDHFNHKIRKLIVSTGVVSTFAGSGSAGGGNGVGTVATLNNPIDIAISSDGSFAISTCQSGHRIRHMVMSTALVTTLAGDGVVGSTNGMGTNARFTNPMGVALSNIDNTFALIADYGNNIIRKIVLSTKVVTRVAGSGAAAATDGIGTLAKIHGPFFIALSSDDAFAVISEATGHRIRKLLLSTWAVTTVAGSPTSATGAAGVTGAADGVGTLARFNQPASVLLTADDLMVYVADRTNHKIRRVELSSQRVSTVVAASGSVALNAPIGLTWIVVDQWLMISSGGSHRVCTRCMAPVPPPLVNPLENQPANPLDILLDNPLASQQDNPRDSQQEIQQDNPLASLLDNLLTSLRDSQLESQLANPLESPQDILQDNPLASQQDNPLASLLDNLLTSLRDSPQDNPLDILQANPRDCLRTNPLDCPQDIPLASQQDNLQTNLRDSLRANPLDSPQDILQDNPLASQQDNQQANPRGGQQEGQQDNPLTSLQDSLQDSPLDILQDSPLDILQANPRDSPRTNPLDCPQDNPLASQQDNQQDNPRDSPQDILQDNPLARQQDNQQANPRGGQQESQQDNPLTSPQDIPLANPLVNPLASQQANPLVNPLESQQDNPQDNQQDSPLVNPQDNQQDSPLVNPQDNQQDSPQDIQQDNPLASQQDSPQDNQQESLQDYPLVNPLESQQANPLASQQDYQLDSLLDNQQDYPLASQQDYQQDSLQDNQQESLQDHPLVNPLESQLANPLDYQQANPRDSQQESLQDNLQDNPLSSPQDSLQVRLLVSPLLYHQAVQAVNRPLNHLGFLQASPPRAHRQYRQVPRPRCHLELPQANHLDYPADNLLVSRQDHRAVNPVVSPLVNRHRCRVGNPL
jgi:hypothetical protein